MCVFRENTEDIYAGIEWEAGTPEAEKFYQFLKNEMGSDESPLPPRPLLLGETCFP